VVVSRKAGRALSDMTSTEGADRTVFNGRKLDRMNIVLFT
jgi:hypothetical protein